MVGGGLHGGLIALALLDARPEARLVLFEREATLGGNHTWSFHEASVPAAARRWFAPLVEHRWPRYTVRFPGLERTLALPYATCSSARLAAVVAARLAAAPRAALRLDSEVAEVGRDGVRLATGELVPGRLVVDARGPRAISEPSVQGETSGYQKYLGLEVELAEAIDPEAALLMDATVEQRDADGTGGGAFRFMFMLPLSSTRALVEDTCFSNQPRMDLAHVRQRTLEWLAARGHPAPRIVREEHGRLPMPWRALGPIPRAAPLVAGIRGGWSHPATGWSVPIALRLACFVAARTPGEVFGADFDALATGQEQQAQFAHLLNELLFCAAEPAKRWMVFRHFYELPDDLAVRFYDLTLTAGDKRRMFLRKPPPGVSFFKAMRILPRWTLK